MVVLDSLDSYQGLFVRWKEAFERLIKTINDNGKEPVVVAMSRKMPRLIETINKEFPKFLNFHFVSEHVLPYILLDIDASKQSIVIVDDAIYYGSTIRNISGYIKNIVPEVVVYVCPLAISEVVGSIPDVQVIRHDDNVISEQSIPFFTTYNAIRLLRLSRPIDVEFPILHIPVTRQLSFQKDTILRTLADKFQDCDIYEIEHCVGREEGKGKKQVYNYNVLPKKGSQYDNWNQDFCKLRFFVSDKFVQIVSYAPGILTESVLFGRGPLFSNNGVQAVWEAVRGREMASWPEMHSEEWSINVTKDAYSRQCVRSKVIWANYLASILYMLVRKKQILGFLTEIYGPDCVQQVIFSQNDTCLLLPPEMVCDITKHLNDLFGEEEDDYGRFLGSHSAVIANQELVPNEYSDVYKDSVQRGLQRSRSAEEALSMFFSEQHFLLNEEGLTRHPIHRTQRLRFGITYGALENKLSFPLGDSNLWKYIHRWIDKNIDEGTVKPKYERIEYRGDVFWLRMFRAGENENAFAKLHRLCGYIIEKLRQKDYREYVERDSVENLLTLVWKDPCEIVNYAYWDDSFVESQTDGVFSLYTRGQNGKQKKFLDVLLDWSGLHAIEDSTKNKRVSTFSSKPISTMFSANQEQAVSDYVDVYWLYAKTKRQSNIMNNFFPKTGENAYIEEHNKLASWLHEFMEKLLQIDDVHTPGHDMQEEFDQLNVSFNRLLLQIMKVPVLVVDELQSSNIRAIEAKISLPDSKDYILFKKKLLLAAVVKELYEQIFLFPEDVDSTAVLEGYLDAIQTEEGPDNVIRHFIHLDEAERQDEDRRQDVVQALQAIIKRQIMVGMEHSPYGSIYQSIID